MFASVSHVLTGLKHRWQIHRDPIRYAQSIGVQLGHDCRLLGLELSTFGSEPYLVKLGDHVTITSGVRFITHDGGVWVFRQKYPDIDVVAPIVIGDNVFIGLGTIIMPGVMIGSDSIIGAGSVVTRNIAAGTVAAGVPARPINTIEGYWDKVKTKAVYMRSLPHEQKKKLYMEDFRAILNNGNHLT